MCAEDWSVFLCKVSLDPQLKAPVTVYNVIRKSEVQWGTTLVNDFLFIIIL